MRDFWVRLRDKGFVISTCITLAVFSVFILAACATAAPEPPRSTSGSWSIRPAVPRSAAAYAPAQAAAVTAQIEAAAASALVEVRVVEVHPPDAGRDQLRDGSLDGVLAADGILEGDADVPSQLRQIVQAALVRDRIVAALEAAGATEAEIDAALNVPAVDPRGPCNRVIPNREENGGDRVHRRAAALRAALRIRRVGGHGRDRGEVLARGRDPPVRDPPAAADGRQDRWASACSGSPS